MTVHLRLVEAEERPFPGKRLADAAEHDRQPGHLGQLVPWRDIGPGLGVDVPQPLEHWVVERPFGVMGDRVERRRQRREWVRHDGVTPVEESVAIGTDHDVAAVEVVVLDRRLDAGRRDARRQVSDLGHVAPSGPPGLGRHRRARRAALAARSGRRRAAGPGRAGSSIGASVRSAGREHRRDRCGTLDRALQLRVFGEDPLPGRRIVVAVTVGLRRPQRRACVVEQDPAACRLDGQRQDDSTDAQVAERQQQRAFVGVAQTDRLQPGGAAIGRDAESGRPRPDVWLLDGTGDLSAECRELGLSPADDLRRARRDPATAVNRRGSER